MDTLLQFFQSLTGSVDARRAIFVVAAGATVFLLAMGVSLLVLALVNPVRRRLNQMAVDVEPEHTGVAHFLKALAPVKRYVLPAKEEERSRTEKRLAAAGFRSANALPVFYSIKTVLAVIFLLAVLASSILLPRLSAATLLFLASLAAFIGLFLPNLLLHHLVERRQRRLRNGFPDALDMLVVCVEAGLGLMASIQRVAEELRFSHPDLAAELALVTAEMHAGVDRETALKALATRTGLEDIHGLVSLLVQTLKFGTSIAETLRVYAEEFRDKRLQRAEEQAAKIGTKLIFPLVLCLWPAFFVVAVGPAVMRFIEVFRVLGERAAQ
jgi:tight adherence protein C